MEPWLSFFASYFEDGRRPEEWILQCEDHEVAKIMMHQTQRLISLAEDLPLIRPHDECLRLAFLLICAEHIAKLEDGSDGQGESRKYVKQFFEKFVEGKDQDRLAHGFQEVTNAPAKPMTLEDRLKKVVDLLYDTRCKLIHEGATWGLTFHDGVTSMISGEPPVEVKITITDLQRIVVKGCIAAITRKLSKEMVKRQACDL